MLRLLEIAGSKRSLLTASVLLSIMASVLRFVPFVAIYKIVTELAGHAANPLLIDSSVVWHWCYVMLGAFIGNGILSLASVLFSHFAAFSLLYELRVLITQKLVQLPLGFFTKRTSGDLKKTMQEDVERIELFVAHHFPDVITAVAFPILLIGYMFVVDWRLTLILLAVLVIAFSIIGRYYRGDKIKEITQRYLDAIGRMNSSLIEYIRGIQVVKTFTRSTEAYKQLNDDIRNYRHYVYSVNREYRNAYVWFQLFLLSPLLFIIPASVLLLLRSDCYIDYLPTVLMFFIFGMGIFFPAMKIMWIGGLLNQNSMGVQHIDEVLFKDEIDEPDSPITPRDASVVFDSVSFAYDKVPVLKGISFTARPGTVTALVGPSGSGKTTVAMLAARFWDITQGEVRIGGVPINRISVAELMDRIAFVFQDNMLFFDTIEENIRMGNKKATFEQVVAAAKAAQCHEFIEALPSGYKTLVGEGGTYLSGGEQQRIGLARAVLKDAPIILLDEATAYADPENESKILEAFSNLIRGKTVLVIAHRLGTITNADQILYIDKGEITERGTHNELLALGGDYARMWEIYNRTALWTIGAVRHATQ